MATVNVLHRLTRLGRGSTWREEGVPSGKEIYKVGNTAYQAEDVTGGRGGVLGGGGGVPGRGGAVRTRGRCNCQGSDWVGL